MEVNISKQILMYNEKMMDENILQFQDLFDTYWLIYLLKLYRRTSPLQLFLHVLVNGLVHSWSKASLHDFHLLWPWESSTQFVAIAIYTAPIVSQRAVKITEKGTIENVKCLAWSTFTIKIFCLERDFSNSSIKKGLSSLKNVVWQKIQIFYMVHFEAALYLKYIEILDALPSVPSLYCKKLIFWTKSHRLLQ